MNYVWINNSPYRPPPQGSPLRRSPEGRRPALQNAARYPDTKFILWADYGRFDDTTRTLLQSHIYISGTPNFEIRNLRDIKPYAKASDALNNNTDDFSRPDIARLYVLQDCFKKLPHDNVLYCDLDVEDVRIGCEHTERLLQQHGLALSKTKIAPGTDRRSRLTRGTKPATTLGLGYIALQQGMGETFLNKHLLRHAYYDIVQRKLTTIESAMKEALRAYGHGRPVHPEILLPPISYKIPENLDYIEWKLNGYDYDDHTLD